MGACGGGIFYQKNMKITRTKAKQLPEKTRTTRKKNEKLPERKKKTNYQGKNIKLVPKIFMPTPKNPLLVFLFFSDFVLVGLFDLSE